MNECIYYDDINGNVGDCTVNPPLNKDGDLPRTEKGCHCRFYAQSYPVVEVEQPDKKLTARQRALAKKKAEQEKSKFSE